MNKFCKVFNKRIVFKYEAESRDETQSLLSRAVTGYFLVGVLQYGPLQWRRSSSYILRSLALKTLSKNSHERKKKVEKLRVYFYSKR